jgi:hypothetical protein
MSEQNNVTRTGVAETAPAEKGTSNGSSEVGKVGNSPPAQPVPPHEEQRRYWRRDLTYKLWSLCISFCGFVLVLLSLQANNRQISNNAAQSERMAKSIRLALDATVVDQVTKLDEVFMRRPQMVPYFYDGKAISEGDENYAEVSATALMVLDVFDLLVGQNRRHKELWETPEAWDAWMIDVFATSPVMRDTIARYPTWYGDTMKELCTKGYAKSGGKASPCVKP